MTGTEETVLKCPHMVTWMHPHQTAGLPVLKKTDTNGIIAAENFFVSETLFLVLLNHE